MEKFTSGRWINKSEKGHYFGGSAAINSEDDKSTIALIYGNNQEQQDANARLIASAPDMYAILDEILKNDGMMPDTMGKINQLLNRINTQI